MALTGAGLIDEVQAVTGRTASGEALADATRCARWLNEAQIKIARDCKDLECLSFDNRDSIDTTQTLRYPISDITVGDASDLEILPKEAEAVPTTTPTPTLAPTPLPTESPTPTPTESATPTPENSPSPSP